MAVIFFNQVINIRSDTSLTLWKWIFIPKLLQEYKALLRVSISVVHPLTVNTVDFGQVYLEQYIIVL